MEELPGKKARTKTVRHSEYCYEAELEGEALSVQQLLSACSCCCSAPELKLHPGARAQPHRLMLGMTRTQTQVQGCLLPGCPCCRLCVLHGCLKACVWLMQSRTWPVW